MKIHKCHICEIYTIGKECPRCGEKTSSAHYKHIKVRKKESETKVQK